MIFGKSNAAIAEKAAFFWSLKSTLASDAHRSNALWIEDSFAFDLAALSSEQLARVFDSNPARRFAIRNGSWNTQQSLVLATRPYPLSLRLSSTIPGDVGTFSFTDDGTAFVDALQRRQSAFGLLCLVFVTTGNDRVPHDMPFSHANIKLLFELEDTFETLIIGCLDEEIALLPFSAKVKVLNYTFFGP